MSNIKDLSNLPKPEKKALTKLLHDNGYTYRQMQDYFDVSPSTLCEWANEEVPEEISERIRTIYQKEIEEHNKRCLSMVYKRLEELIPRETSISEVIKAGEFSKGKQQAGSQTNVQVNFTGAIQKTKENYGDL